MTGPSPNPVYLGAADVENCFHRIKITEGLGQYFVLPLDFTAKELGLVGQRCGERTLDPDSRVRLRCAALPMGFGWSLYFAQRINEAVMGESKQLSHSTLINDSSGTVFLDVSSRTLYHFVYVDNLGVLTLTEAEAVAVVEGLLAN